MEFSAQDTKILALTNSADLTEPVNASTTTLEKILK